jgi:uncharacterized membrane protein HdeD (DUF308 family)
VENIMNTTGAAGAGEIPVRGPGGSVREAAREARNQAAWTMVTGIVLGFLGMLAVISPFAAGIAVDLTVGVLLVVASVVRIVSGFKAHGWGERVLGWLTGAFALVAGLALLSNPAAGLAILTLILGVYFFADGVTEMILSFKLRRQRGWGVMMFNGIIGIFLGFLILYQWPVSGLWAVGIVTGIRLLISGFSMITLGGVARRMSSEAMAPA